MIPTCIYLLAKNACTVSGECAAGKHCRSKITMTSIILVFYNKRLPLMLLKIFNRKIDLSLDCLERTNN